MSLETKAMEGELKTENEAVLLDIFKNGITSMNQLEKLIHITDRNLDITTAILVPSELLQYELESVSSRTKTELYSILGENIGKDKSFYSIINKDIMGIVGRISESIENSFDNINTSLNAFLDKTNYSEKISNKHYSKNTNIILKTILSNDYDGNKADNNVVINKGATGKDVYVSMITIEQLDKSEDTYNLFRQFALKLPKQNKDRNDIADGIYFKSGKKYKMLEETEQAKPIFYGVKTGDVLKLDYKDINISFSKNGSFKIRLDLRGTKEEIMKQAAKVESIYKSYCQNNLETKSQIEDIASY